MSETATRTPSTTSADEAQQTKKEEFLNTTSDTISLSSEEEGAPSNNNNNHTSMEDDVVSELPLHLSSTSLSLINNKTNNKRRSSDLKVASQTKDVRFILHKMRERRADVQLQIWAVEALQTIICGEEEENNDVLEEPEEITKNIIRAMQRHPYSKELQHKGIVSLSGLAKASYQVKDSLAKTPEGMDLLLGALQQQSEDDDDDDTNHHQLEIYTAVFSLFAVGFDQFDHSMLVDEGAIAEIMQVLQPLTPPDDDNDTAAMETIFEVGTLALSELSWLCEDMSVPQVFPDLSEVIDLVVGIMKHYPYNSNIQNSGGEILRHVMNNDPDSIVMVKEAGGAQALVSALNNHLDQEDVLVEGCFSLIHFLQFPDIRDKCFYTVINTMTQHVQNPDVQQGGCAFLADAAEHTSNTFRFLFDTTQSVPLLMTAMEQFPDNERLQEHGCRAFQTVGPWLKSRTERKQMKVLGLVVAAMKNHSKEHMIQLYGCSALHGMASSWGDNATVFMVKVGGMKCIKATMEQFMEDPEVFWLGLAIISGLDLVGIKFARDAVMKEDNMRIVTDGIKRHGGHKKVQEYGGKVIEMLASVKQTLGSQSNLGHLNQRGDCCLRCLKLSLQRESGERWQGCTCIT